MAFNFCLPFLSHGLLFLLNFVIVLHVCTYTGQSQSESLKAWAKDSTFGKDVIYSRMRSSYVLLTLI